HCECVLARRELHAHPVLLLLCLSPTRAGIHSGLLPRRTDQPIGNRWSVYRRTAALRERHGLAPRNEYHDDAGVQPSRFRSDPRLHDSASFRFWPRHEREWPLRLPERRRAGPRESSGEVHRERILARRELHADRARIRVGVPPDWIGIRSGLVPRRSDLPIGSRWSLYRPAAALSGRFV